MLKNLKLVILDYPHQNLESPDAKRVFADTVLTKQMNFFRASESYISMNALDMVSTHYLIYDVSNVFQPKPILAIRTIFEARAKHHNLGLPIDEYIEVTPKAYKEKFLAFKAQVGPIVDCSAWFVDPEYSYAKTQLPLSEIAYFTLVCFILRKGFHNWVGATNERFKASRWAMKTGFCEDGLIFTHHKVPDPHKLLLISDFNYEWLNECVTKYGQFLLDSQVILPPSTPLTESIKSFEEVFKDIRDQSDRKLRTA